MSSFFPLMSSRVKRLHSETPVSLSAPLWAHPYRQPRAGHRLITTTADHRRNETQNVSPLEFRSLNANTTIATTGDAQDDPLYEIRREGGRYVLHLIGGLTPDQVLGTFEREMHAKDYARAHHTARETLGVVIEVAPPRSSSALEVAGNALGVVFALIGIAFMSLGVIVFVTWVMEAAR